MAGGLDCVVTCSPETPRRLRAQEASAGSGFSPVVLAQHLLLLALVGFAFVHPPGESVRRQLAWASYPESRHQLLCGDRIRATSEAPVSRPQL